jgi:hypothetical protein
VTPVADDDVPARRMTPGGFAVVAYEDARRWAIAAGLCDKRFGLNLRDVNHHRMRHEQAPLVLGEPA